MTLREFDNIRQYLPDDVQIEIISAAPQQLAPKSDEVWAIELYDWGNHDGRFNVMCAACGDVVGQDLPAGLRQEFTRNYYHKPCPKCGKTFIRKGDIKR